MHNSPGRNCVCLTVASCRRIQEKQKPFVTSAFGCLVCVLAAWQCYMLAWRGRPPLAAAVLVGQGWGRGNSSMARLWGRCGMVGAVGGRLVRAGGTTGPTITWRRSTLWQYWGSQGAAGRPTGGIGRGLPLKWLRYQSGGCGKCSTAFRLMLLVTLVLCVAHVRCWAVQHQGLSHVWFTPSAKMHFMCLLACLLLASCI